MQKIFWMAARCFVWVYCFWGDYAGARLQGLFLAYRITVYRAQQHIQLICQILQADSKVSFLFLDATKTAPASCYGNRGGSYTLLVLSQALTQLLAGILDSSLRECQNYRAFAVAMCFPFTKPYFQRMALYFVLFHRVNLILQFAVTTHDLSHHAV